MKDKKKLILWIIIPLVLLLLIGAVIWNAVRRGAEARQQPSAMLAQVERGDLEVWVTGNGTVSAAVEEAVRAGMTGTIETYLLKEGQEVAAGEKLVTLKFQDLGTQIEIKELDISMRERELKNLKDEKTTATVQAPEAGTVQWLVSEGEKVKGGAPIALIHPLAGDGDDTTPVTVSAPLSVSGTWTITWIEVVNGDPAKGNVIAKIKDQVRADQIKQQISLAELQIKQARLELADLEQRQQQNREDSVIRAPIGGTVLLPEPAGAVGAGMNVPQGTVLATIVDYTKLQVVIPVDELDINKVREGQQVSITVEALPGQAIAGEVSKVASRGRIQGGVTTFDVTVDIVPVEGLKVGMNVSAAILVDLRSDTLLVPIEAVFEQEGENMIMVIAEDREAGKSGPRPVKVVTGANDTSYIEILAGVKEGQQIVIQGSATEFDPRGGMMGNDDGFRPFQGEEGR